ncbi:cytochrome P460 family protein [Ralstonia insidiosa]|uniref:Cytochrome P460 family protein n=1 Tax=Ralstonia insidiosa TaxID=190721 RepID=A0A848NMP8_9RALS|nr:cytochrome P460 family protein [Ralstonia insidiosa]NMV36422.1 cytochrome P460 family protein [Ralstonia insidiosa]
MIILQIRRQPTFKATQRTLACLIIATSVSLSAYAAEPLAVPTANFIDKETVAFPGNFRTWPVVSTAVVPKGGINPLDLQPAPTPEFMIVYVEPTALSVFLKTRQWPDGSQIVKEFSQAKVDGNGKYSQIQYSGVGMMVKNAKHFSGDAGNWAYFSFGRHSGPYAINAKKLPTARCASCHIEKVADKDYVFSDLHLGLQPPLK